MPSSVALLRGFNVGGKNLIRMPNLAAYFRDAGYRDVRTYIQSGNVLFTADRAAPANHGSKELRSDVFFLKHPLTAEAAYARLPELREGVDSVALGPGAIYFSRVAAQASKTRITRLMSMPVFRQITVRNWSTTTRVFEMLERGG